MTSDTALLSARLVFFLGVNTGYLTDAKPDARFIDFYRQRSSKQLHCAIIGNVVVPNGHGSNSATPMLSRDKVWRDVAEAVAKAGSLPGIQLATAWLGYSGSRSFRSRDWPSTIADARSRVASMGAEAIERVLDSFDMAAEIAIWHGFRHVQVHAAHGYLPNLLVDSRICDRAPWVLERLSTFAQRLRTGGVETSIRISLRTGDPEFDASGACPFLASIATLPFDFLDVSSGFYNIDKRLIYPARPDILAARRRETLALAERFPRRAFILSGRAMNQATDDLIPNVHIGICRDLIANPRFLEEPSSGCVNCGKCHYFSRGKSSVSCQLWKNVE